MRGEGIGFGGVFLAMLCALLAHDLLRLIFAALGLSVVLSGLSGALDRAGPVAPPVVLQQPRQAAPHPMRYHGPIAARQLNTDTACIAGAIAERKGNGWSDLNPRTPCIATSE